VDLEEAHNVATLNNLGNLSFVLDGEFNWDGKNERFVGDDCANRHPTKRRYLSTLARLDSLLRQV
jgi:hypothetical protein